MITIKRVYEPVAPGDGRRVLVDRLWPRGISRDEARIDEWTKELSPSDALRKWYGHAPERFPEFRLRYRKELERQPEALARLAEEGRRSRVTLVFGAKAPELSNAAVLKERLETVPGPPARPKRRPAPTD